MPLPIDQHPRLLPTITHDYAEQVADWLDADKEGASDERTKLKLLRCKQCRDARKKFYPENRVHPAKCDRCLALRAKSLAYSEPQWNTGNRIVNIKDKTRDKERGKDTETATFQKLSRERQKELTERRNCYIPSLQTNLLFTLRKSLSDMPVPRVRPRPPVQNQHKVLRILIDAKEHIACADSGSVKNIVSKSLVTRENWEIRREPEDLKDFEMGSGKCTRSIRRVRVSVQLPGKTLQSPKQWFYVFETCAVDMVLGMEFLEEAEILTKNRHLLEACPAELRDFSALLWIGSPKHDDDSAGSIKNRLRCSLDGHDLVAVADTGSDLNMMSFECAKRERFRIDTREEARTWVKFGDGSKSRTIGQVYVGNLSLDWRTTETPASKQLPPNRSNNMGKVGNGSSQEDDGDGPFCTIFHVLPGLPCDVIFGRDLLYQLDAFNRCPDLMPSLSAGKNNHYEFKVLISLGRLTSKLRRSKTKQASNKPLPHTKEAHDNERFSEIFRRSQKKEEIALMPEGQQDQARAREKRRAMAWDAAHATCVHCLPV